MIFVYNYKNISEVAAIDGFNAVLKNQALRYERVFRKPFQLSTRRVGDVLIGQIVVNYDIDGWQPNYENDGYGIVLSGVCEEFLGDKLNSHPIKEIFNSIKNNPSIIADWDGRFSLCTWNYHTKEGLLQLVLLNVPIYGIPMVPMGKPMAVVGSHCLNLSGIPLKSIFLVQVNSSKPDMFMGLAVY